MREKKTGIIILAVVLIISCFASYAQFGFGGADRFENTDTEEKKAEVQGEIDRLKESLEENRRAYEAQAELLDGQERELAMLEIEAMEQNDLIDETNADIAAKQLEINAKELEVEVAREKVDEQIKSLRKRLRTMYKFGKTGYLEILLSSDSLINAMTRMDRIRMITEYDKNLLFDLKASKETLEIAKGKLEDEKKAMEALKEEQIQQKEALERTYEQLDAKRIQTQNNIEALSWLIAQEEEEQAFWDRELKKLSIKREYVGGLMDWPLDLSNIYVTSTYGPRVPPVPGASDFHAAIDIGAPWGSLIYSPLDGEVIASYYTGSVEGIVVLDHGGGITTTYLHMAERYVAEGETVARGQAIGAVGGLTGISSGPHLHFEVREGGDRVDPLAYFSHVDYIIWE